MKSGAAIVLMFVFVSSIEAFGQGAGLNEPQARDK